MAPVPHGHWKTTTFVTALRNTGLTAPRVIDGAILPIGRPLGLLRPVFARGHLTNNPVAIDLKYHISVIPVYGISDFAHDCCNRVER
jgi:hypothetical protein